ncbi:indolepyruvate ferredoxin oxidoreductase subunit alpha [Candidatus Dependentiae bacterium]|nr:indolepyruvate ferredoxin oxidoreductase subunit alpha [Candidatus Dependentiae bacterium]
MKKLLSGNEAIALGAYESDVKFASGYPGTPSTEILENLVKYDGVYCQWSPNEKVAFETGIGASISGHRTIVTMKHVGVNVAADPLMTFSYTGVKAGFILVAADDPELHSSQNEQDSRNYAKFAKVPMLEPSDSSEAKEMVLSGYEISEQFDTPLILRTTTRLSHTRTIVETGEKKVIDIKPGFEKKPQKYVMIPAFGRMRHKFVEERLIKLQEYNNQSELNRIIKAENKNEKFSKTGIITSGVVFNYVSEVIKDVDILKLGMVYPVPDRIIKQFCAGKDRIVVIEELDGFLEEEILKLKLDVEIIGKSWFPKTGELDQDKIRSIFYNKPECNAEIKNIDVPPRPPVLCAGCSHRAAYSVLREKSLIVTGDIGCYTLGTLEPLNSLDTCICMGAGIGTAIGMVKTNPDYFNKIVAVIGDSTFIHSGITGIIDALYNKAPITTIILDNRITAMTGHQEHPGTGKTLSGEDTIAIEYKKLVIGIGYQEECVDVVNPLNIKLFSELVDKHLNLNKPSVLIAQSPCALLNKKGKPVYFSIDPVKCSKCGKCISTGCPAIMKKNGIISILKESCRACGLCVQYCELNAIKSVKF